MFTKLMFPTQALSQMLSGCGLVGHDLFSVPYTDIGHLVFCVLAFEIFSLPILGPGNIPLAPVVSGRPCCGYTPFIISLANHFLLFNSQHMHLLSISHTVQRIVAPNIITLKPYRYLHLVILYISTDMTTSSFVYLHTFLFICIKTAFFSPHNISLNLRIRCNGRPPF